MTLVATYTSATAYGPGTAYNRGSVGVAIYDPTTVHVCYPGGVREKIAIMGRK